MMKIKQAILSISLLLPAVPGAVAQQSLTLSQAQCREMALAHSEDLQKAETSLRTAGLDRKIAQTAALPRLEGTATGLYMVPDLDLMGSEMRVRGSYMAGLTLTQPIYVGGKIVTGMRLAKIGEQVASEQRRMTRMEVIADADNGYWTYISVLQKIRMVESYCTQMDTLYRQVQTSVRTGMATNNDLLRIEAKRSELRYQLQRTLNGADLCRLSLCKTVGADPDTELVLSDTLIALTPPGMLDEAIDARPELKLLQKQVEAGRQQIKMTRADFLPTVGLSLGYTYYDNIKTHAMVDAGGGVMQPYDQNFCGNIGLGILSVKVPLFHWGEGSKKVRKARFELQNAQLDLQKNTRLMGIEVRQASQNVRDGYMLVESAQTAFRQAEENLRVMSNRYKNALSPLTDLLDAQSQWQQSNSNLIEAKTQYKIYQTEYLRATGRLE